MFTAIIVLITVGVLVWILGVRAKDLPEPQPVSPFQHLDERKAAIYENLRDLQFEYRVGKLSDEDYQATKRDLQKELAQVLAEVDKLKEQLTKGIKPVPKPPVPAKPVPKPRGFVCPHCDARFEKDMKFCGECGKPMKAAGEA
jgi:hypothetical protein